MILTEKLTLITKHHFRPGGMAGSQWTRSVKGIRDPLVADYSVSGANTTRRVAYCPPTAVLPFSLALSVSNYKRKLLCGGEL
jgi:hypothetical protein